MVENLTGVFSFNHILNAYILSELHKDMYKIIVQVIDTEFNGNPVIHEMHSIMFPSIQQAMEAYNGKDLFKTYLETENEIMKDLNAMKERSTRHE